MAKKVRAECFAQIVELRTQRQISSVVNADIKSEHGKLFARPAEATIIAADRRISGSR